MEVRPVEPHLNYQCVSNNIPDLQFDLASTVNALREVEHNGLCNVIPSDQYLMSKST